MPTVLTSDTNTKNRPHRFDCHAKAEQDEPMFTLIGRDPAMPWLVIGWAMARNDLLAKGKGSPNDMEKIEQALFLAAETYRYWRIKNSIAEAVARVEAARLDDDGGRPLGGIVKRPRCRHSLIKRQERDDRKRFECVICERRFRWPPKGSKIYVPRAGSLPLSPGKLKKAAKAISVVERKKVSRSKPRRSAAKG